MRIIGGEFRSRPLKSVPGRETRPTPGRLREALFNVLSPRIGGSIFVDAYAGTGAVGIEALSRGARKAIFIERARSPLAVIRENLASLGIEARAQLVQGRTAVWIAQFPADIVFLDPPYTLEQEYRASLAALAEAPPPLVIAQHASRFALERAYGKLRAQRTLKQGDNSLTFFAPD